MILDLLTVDQTFDQVNGFPDSVIGAVNAKIVVFRVAPPAVGIKIIIFFMLPVHLL